MHGCAYNRIFLIYMYMYILLVGMAPDDVIGVSQEILLLPLGHVVDHAHAGHEIGHLAGGRVEHVVSTLVAPVPVHPLQSELAVRSRLIGHTVRGSRQPDNACRVHADTEKSEVPDKLAYCLSMYFTHANNRWPVTPTKSANNSSRLVFAARMRITICLARGTRELYGVTCLRPPHVLCTYVRTCAAGYKS